jgi:predicted esterase
VAEELHVYYFDTSDVALQDPELARLHGHEDPVAPKIVRSIHASLEAALAQAQADRETGGHPIRIENAKGKIVWTP